jgi:NADH-quinone oxidoreductase subunit L
MSERFLALAVLLLPAFGAALLAGRGWRLSRVFTQAVGPGVVWLSFLATLALFAERLGTDAPADLTYWTWIRSGSFDLPFNLVVDHLSLFMCLVISGVGALIVTYSVGYMAHEDNPSYARFFCYMDLFIFSMLLLVLAGNFVFLIIGWAMVGLSSFLLIGFWYWKQSAVLAARKAFVMNVIGDIGMILGAFVVFVNFHQLSYASVFRAIPKQDSGALELIAFLLLVGAVAKSAQLPLHTWLPDAMEGPTPVSALIHAATMVTAGVYLVGRMHVIYDVASVAHHAVAVIGTLTAIFAATIAVVQVDIKRVLAYSTMSQIGYMFLAVGIGAYGAGFFHLLSHAFFKALLFLSAGNVIHAMNDEQDMRRYGGLRDQLRTTSVCFLIGSLSLAGVIPLVGFWSKELVLGDTFSKPGDQLAQYLWFVGFLTALLTGFYTGRMWYLSFKGSPSAERPVDEPHEPPGVMVVPVVVLTVLTCVGGILQPTAGFNVGPRLIETYLAPAVGALGWEPRGLEWVATAATLLLAIATFFLARYFYVGGYAGALFDPESFRTRFEGIQRLLERKYYFDDLYDRAFVRPMDWLARASDRWVDRPLIDGAVMGVGTTTEASAGNLSMTQSGYFRNYVLVFTGGALVLAAIVLYRTLT